MEYGFVDGMIVGMARAKAAIARGDVGRVFDWDKAARRIIEEQAFVASSGLQSDWPSTGGEIWRNGKPVPQEDTYTYLASLWATPELDIDGNVEACFIGADQTEWDSGTYWPASALAIIEAAQLTSNESASNGLADPQRKKEVRHGHCSAER